VVAKQALLASGAHLSGAHLSVMLARRLLAKHTPALLGMQSIVWGDSHMLPSRGVRVWVVYLTPKIERVISLLSASPVGEARCRCRKVWLTRIDCYFFCSVMLTLNEPWPPDVFYAISLAAQSYYT
jgi:hypothetical protein